jgi:hypothetical protein
MYLYNSDREDILATRRSMMTKHIIICGNMYSFSRQ